MASKAATRRFKTEMLRSSYYQFFREFWSLTAAEKLVDSWYIKTLCDELQVVSERVFADEPKEYDLYWNCPPGTSKSTIVSVLWQPWAWTRMPSARFISGSYAERLALDHSRKSRDVVLSDKYQELFPEIKLRDDQNTKGYFANTAGGMRYAVGVGGSVIGMHSHFLLVDDPIDPQGALSDLILAESNLWINETLSRRKVNIMLTPMVLIMQRLHQNDPTGNGLERGGRIRNCCVPCDTSWEVKPSQFREYYQEGLLDPIRLPREALLEAEKELGTAGYAGQYGQSPVPRGGAMFQVDRLVHAPSFLIPTTWKRGPVRFWDKAACLVEGTMVETIGGSVPIEKVRVNDLVLTRAGYKKVKWAGVSGYVDELARVEFDDGRSLIGTPDHPVWTENRGWVELQSLRCYDNIVSLTGGCLSCREDRNDSQTPRHESSKASHTAGGRARSISRRCGGTRRTSDLTASLCIRQSGKPTTARCPRSITSITRMKIRTTTTSPIWSALPKVNITESTAISGRRTSTGNCLLESDQRHYRQAISGGRQHLTWSTSAVGADSHSRAGAWTGTYLSIARLGVGTKQVVIERAVPVYDLTVEDQHEFYANGILVHNTLGGGAYTVGCKMALDHADRVWILDVNRFQLDSGGREARILATAKMDGRGVKQWVEREPAGSGKESAEATVKRLTLAGLRAGSQLVSGDKELRADPLSEQVNMGNVTVVDSFWTHALVEEMRFFPRSKYKDQIDAASGGFSMLTKHGLRVGAL